jgi:glycosyltransferase involved in cell wall biosynthesis
MKNKFYLNLMLFSFIVIFSVNYKFLIEKSRGYLFLLENKPDITLIGRVKMADGLGRLLVELLDELSDKYKVSVCSYDNDLSSVPKRLHKLIKYQNPKSLGKYLIYLDPIWLPRHSMSVKDIIPKNKNLDCIRIAYSMAESSQICDEWVFIINSYFDYCLVPDSYYVDVYKNSGVNIPIFSVPLGTNLNDYLKAEIKEKSHKRFTFGNSSALIDRKNIGLLIEAFINVFGDNPDVILKINARNKDSEIENKIRTLSKNNINKNIYLNVEELSQNEYLRFMSSLDCFVNISKGEGFSIQPREAMALGMPVICSDNTAQKTLCNTQLIKTVKSDISEPAYYWYTKRYHGEQYTCKVEDVEKALVDVYQNYSEHLKLAQRRREYAREFTSKKFAERIISFIEQIEQSNEIH